MDATVSAPETQGTNGAMHTLRYAVLAPAVASVVGTLAAPVSVTATRRESLEVA